MYFDPMRQFAVLFRWNMASLRSRTRPTAVAVLGFAGVVAVFLAVFSIQQGFEYASRSSEGNDLVMVTRAAAQTEISSMLDAASVHTIESIPGVAHAESGLLVAPEVLLVVNIPKKGSVVEASVPVRGIDGQSLKMRERVVITAGRMLEPGLNEIIVGRGAAATFDGLTVGSTQRWGRYTWQVVGVFEADGSIHESEIWADRPVLQTAYERGNIYQAVYAKLESPQAYDDYKRRLERDARLSVIVRKEREYYQDQNRFQSQFIATAGASITLLMAAGAIFGAINMMYSAVAARTQEIGVLRALGFQRGAVVAAVLLEGMMLGLFGGMIGGLITWLVLNGYQVSTLSFETFTQVVFAFRVTPDLLWAGIALALAMGFVGGLPSALSAVRVPIPVSLRRR